MSKNKNENIKTEPESAATAEEITANQAKNSADQAGGENAPAEINSVENTTDEAIVKSNFRKVKLTDFRGSFGDAKFGDDGVCDQISDETFEVLRKQFPDAEIEELN